MKALPTNSIRLMDLFSEAIASLRIGLGRAFLVSGGTVLAAAGLVTTSGIAATLARQVSTDLESSPIAGRSVALALTPRSTPSDSLREGIEGNVADLSLGVIVVAFLVGAIWIASAATASVHARTSEIGLRVAMGARPRHVFAQLLMETMLLGGLGGLVGCTLGLTALATICAWNGWTPALDAGWAAVALAASVTSGLVAGLPPAWRAMRLQPAEALRR